MPFDKVDRPDSGLVCKRPMPTNEEIMRDLNMAIHDLFCMGTQGYEPCGDPLCLTCRRNAKARPRR